MKITCTAAQWLERGPALAALGVTEVELVDGPAPAPAGAADAAPPSPSPHRPSGLRPDSASSAKQSLSRACLEWARAQAEAWGDGV